DKAGAVLGAADIENRDDVRMVEAGDGAGFGQVGFGVTRPSDKPGVRHLDGHEPLQLLVVGQVDDAEATLAQDFLHPVATNLLRSFGGNLFHGCWLIRAGLDGILWLSHGRKTSGVVARDGFLDPDHSTAAFGLPACGVLLRGALVLSNGRRGGWRNKTALRETEGWDEPTRKLYRSSTS